MSSRPSTQARKRKRASDNSTKSEPTAKKIKRNKLKLENDLLESSSSKLRSGKNAGKIKLTVNENLLERSESYFKSDPDINNNIPSTRIKLRDLRVLLDKSVVENYFKKKLMKSKKKDSQNRTKRKIKRLKKINHMENHGQKTLLDFFNCDTLSGQNLAIERKSVLPFEPIKQEDNSFKKLINVNKVKIERVSVSIKDLVMLCDVKVNLERWQPSYGLKVENEMISSASKNLFNDNAISKFNHYQPKDWIKTEITDDLQINESLARIKIEDTSSNVIMTNDENSMMMEVSEEAINSNKMYCSWDEKCQPDVNAFEIERLSAMKMTDAVSALSNDRLLSFYDECPDVPMEEITENEIIQKVPDAFDENFLNSAFHFNSSRHSWPVSDESGIFMSDDSTNFNELSSKSTINSSFNALDVGNEETFRKL